jgi:hypothetical protein
MQGSAATTTQQVNISSNAGASGSNGLGAGVPISLSNDPAHSIGSELVLDISTPADNASISVSVNSRGGNGVGRPDSILGGPLPSRGVLRSSRIEASGQNSSISAGFTVTGGICFGYSVPNQGISVALPGDFPSIARGASPLAEPVDLSAGPGGNIASSMSLTGGSGGTVLTSSGIRPGDGGRVEVGEALLRAVSGGGSITQTVTGHGGTGGSATSRNGTGGHVSLFNTMSAETSTGEITLTQNANGGTLGGRAVSYLDFDGTSSGILTVTTTAAGGQVSSNSSLNSSLGSGEATTIIRGIGSNTTANATATGNTAPSQMFGAFANAISDATGPSNVNSIATARAGTGVIHGKSKATSFAKVTQPGTIASARASTSGDSGAQNCTAVSEGHPSLPVSWITSTYSADRISRGGSDTSNFAAAGANVQNSAFILNSTRAASFDDQNTTQKQEAVVGPFGTNPVPAGLFNTLTDEKHLISVRFNQGANTLVYPPGLTTTHRHGGAFRLREGASGGSLIMSGLGFTNSGSGFDSGVFRFLKDGATVIEMPFANPSEAAAIFSNQILTLADLSSASAGTVFSWEVEITTSAAAQGYDGNFLLSATSNTGLPIAPPPAPTAGLALQGLSIAADFSDAFALENRFGGTITGGAPFSRITIEASSDLGQNDPWTPIRTLTTDSQGMVVIEPVANPAAPGADKMFIRARSD